ncbi:MAG TPA: glycosyltransferase family 39 protein [Candidatus Kryptonia bacterium]|nr:glycosyltransferase family 39 protein [Candidatus Kryptonia bacterium]
MRPSKIPHIVLLLIVAAALYFWDLGRVPFFGTGEARESLEIQEILFRGKWVLPMRDGIDVPSKPPMYHWLASLTSLALGRVDELSARLPSAILATATLLLVFWVGARKWGAAAGVYSALVLATNFLWIRTARSARVDMTLCALLTGAFVAVEFVAITVRPPVIALIALAVCAAGATLAKGPIGFLLPGLVGFVYIVLRRDFSRLYNPRILLAGAAAIALAGIWYSLAIIEGGVAFAHKQLYVENVKTFFAPGAQSGTPVHSHFYVVSALLSGFAPWSLFLIPLGFDLFRDRGRLDRRGELYPLVWFAAVLTFFAVASGKRTEYILPVYPAAALLLGGWWSRLSVGETRMPKALLRLLQAAAVVAAAASIAVVAAILTESRAYSLLEWIRPWLHKTDQENLGIVRQVIRDYRAVWIAWGIPLIVGALLFVYGVWRSRWPLAFAGLIVYVVAATAPTNRVLHPALARPQTLKPFLATVRSTLSAEDELAFYNTFDYAAVFYFGKRIPLLQDTFGPPLPAGRARYLLIWEDVWNTLSDEQRQQLQWIARSDGTSASMPMIHVDAGHPLDWVGNCCPTEVHLVLARLTPPAR